MYVTTYSSPYPQVGFYGQYCFYLLISMLCWVFFLGTSWSSLSTFNHYMLTASDKDNRFTYIDMNYIIHGICFIGTSVVGTVAFGYYFFLTINRNFTFLSVINGPFSRYNFVPLTCVSILYILGISIEKDETDIYGTFKHQDEYYMCGLIITLLAISTLIFVYNRTIINNAYFVSFLIKKGTYSCLITLLIYHFCYGIVFYIQNKVGDKEQQATFLRGSGYAFIIIIGLVGIGMSRMYYDIAIAVMTSFMELGFGLQCIKDFDNKLLTEIHASLSTAGYIAFALAFGGIVIVILNTTMYRSYIYI